VATGITTVVDARAVRKQLRDFSKDLEKEVRREMRTIATVVRDDARAAVPRGRGRGGRMSSGIRSGADGIVPYVSRARSGGRNDKLSGLAWLDHGGQRPRDTAVRPFTREGRYFFPAVRRGRERAVREMNEIVDRAVRRIN
jgi:hypothetical protein